MALTITRSAHNRSSSRNSSKAWSIKRTCQLAGQRAATVISPSGGVIARSGIICSTPSKPQKDGGKLGHTIKTLMFDPRGGKEL